MPIQQNSLCLPNGPSSLWDCRGVQDTVVAFDLVAKDEETSTGRQIGGGDEDSGGKGDCEKESNWGRTDNQRT